MQQFTHMEPIGFIPGLKNHRKEKADSTKYSKYFTEFAANHPEVEASLVKLCAHALVGYSEERQRKQELKFDAQPVDPMNWQADLAEAFTYRMYQATLEAHLTIRPTVNGTASPAFPYVDAGYATKAAAMDSELHQELMRDKPDPVWVSTPKSGEALPFEDLEEGKLRTFNQVGLFFSAYQKFLFEDQNFRMKSFHEDTWGKYGWVKQYGGVHRLWKSFEKFKTRVMGDVSGWDRKVFLKRVYNLRKKGLTVGMGQEAFDKIAPIFEYCASNTIRPVTSFVDGSVFRRLTGNGSGSNNTTTDNTLAHTIIMFYFFIDRFEKTYLRRPEYEDIVNFVVAALFGDDSALSIDEEYFGFNSPEELKSSLMAAYAAWGLTLKEKTVVIDWKSEGPVKGIEFLGTLGIWSDSTHMYEPAPRVSKLVFSLMCNNSNDTLLAEVSKCVAIWDLLKPTEPELAKEVSKYAEFLLGVARNGNFKEIPNSDKVALERVLAGQLNVTLAYGFE